MLSLAITSYTAVSRFSMLRSVAQDNEIASLAASFSASDRVRELRDSRSQLEFASFDTSKVKLHLGNPVVVLRIDCIVYCTLAKLLSVLDVFHSLCWVEVVEMA